MFLKTTATVTFYKLLAIIILQYHSKDTVKLHRHELGISITKGTMLLLGEKMDYLNNKKNKLHLSLLVLLLLILFFHTINFITVSSSKLAGLCEKQYNDAIHRQGRSLYLLKYVGKHDFIS